MTQSDDTPTIMEWVRRARSAQQALDAMGVGRPAPLTPPDDPQHRHGMVAQLVIDEDEQGADATVLVCDCISRDMAHIEKSSDLLIEALHKMRAQQGIEPEIDPLLHVAHMVVAAYDEGRPPSSEYDIAVMHAAIEMLREVLRGETTA